jgi:hypothetical protein
MPHLQVSTRETLPATSEPVSVVQKLRRRSNRRSAQRRQLQSRANPQKANLSCSARLAEPRPLSPVERFILKLTSGGMGCQGENRVAPWAARPNLSRRVITPSREGDYLNVTLLTSQQPGGTVKRSKGGTTYPLLERPNIARIDARKSRTAHIERSRGTGAKGLPARRKYGSLFRRPDGWRRGCLRHRFSLPCRQSPMVTERTRGRGHYAS